MRENLLNNSIHLHSRYVNIEDINSQLKEARKSHCVFIPKREALGIVQRIKHPISLNDIDAIDGSYEVDWDALDAALDELDLGQNESIFDCIHKTSNKILKSAAVRVNRAANLKHTVIGKIPALKSAEIGLSIELEKTAKNKDGQTISKIGAYGRIVPKEIQTHREIVAAKGLGRSYPQSQLQPEIRVNELRITPRCALHAI